MADEENTDAFEKIGGAVESVLMSVGSSTSCGGEALTVLAVASAAILALGVQTGKNPHDLLQAYANVVTEHFNALVNNRDAVQPFMEAILRGDNLRTTLQAALQADRGPVH